MELNFEQGWSDSWGQRCHPGPVPLPGVRTIDPDGRSHPSALRRRPSVRDVRRHGGPVRGWVRLQLGKLTTRSCRFSISIQSFCDQSRGRRFGPGRHLRTDVLRSLHHPPLVPQEFSDQ